MKTQVVIVNGKTLITLKPENKFETNVLEAMYGDRDKFRIETSVGSDYSYGVRGNYRLEVEITEIES